METVPSAVSLFAFLLLHVKGTKYVEMFVLSAETLTVTGLLVYWCTHKGRRAYIMCKTLVILNVIYPAWNAIFSERWMSELRGFWYVKPCTLVDKHQNVRWPSFNVCVVADAVLTRNKYGAVLANKLQEYWMRENKDCLLWIISIDLPDNTVPDFRKPYFYFESFKK